MQAIGSICAVLSRDQFEAQLPKLVPTILSFYKKEKDHLPITQGFNVVLDVCIKDGSRALSPLLPSVLAIIHPLTCYIPDYSSGSALVKNYNELLRCFQTICVVFSDDIVTFLLEKLNTKDLRMKVGTLAIIKHLITHNGNPFH